MVNIIFIIFTYFSIIFIFWLLLFLLLGDENLTTEKIVDAIYKFPQKLDDNLLKVKGSGWITKELGNIYIYICKINSLMGNNYIPLPFRSNNLVNIRFKIWLKILQF